DPHPARPFIPDVPVWNFLCFGRTGRFASSRPKCPNCFQTVCSHFGRSGRFTYFAYSCPELSHFS
ncbi:hypothetical protein KI387_013462, partial [Taxus chinensis]